DAPAEDGRDDRLASARLVGERLDDHALIVGDTVEDLARLYQPLPHRRGRVRVQATLRARPFREVRSVETVGGVAAEAADGEAELPGTGGMLPIPGRESRRQDLGVLYEILLC